ncbi:metalloregulator ArsR/SmtB family transcription factor [Jeotgalibacillus sp. ET6]|uniref:ArsR/SmtB family transcription factor n=1 Tax=Jeotgalibacillus sp. ET6 TaxID=3037260 RepID=UPI002418AA6F|nr:metalloregulator ArsR/SmtB family transcription factor [Jeotgalibacillus sp. ET6]MDG5471373.1 metalloregulator ArsR/SmtB family transcription factor [Jeotgalibacillus sp. ET6]
MVEPNNENLDLIFHALADATRREMIRLVSEKEKTVSEMAEPFDMSLAAASKHIKVLEKANLIQRTVEGRTHTCRINAETLALASKWLSVYEKFWSKRFDVLESEILKAKKKEH